jgi:hypothetical protein
MFSKGVGFSDKAHFKVTLDVFARKNPDGTMVVMSCLTDQEKFYRITGVAVEIFENIDGKATIGEIVERVRTNYTVPAEKIYADTETFLNKLIDLKIVSYT